MGWLDYLGLGANREPTRGVPDGVQRIIDTLAHLDPARATYLACVAYILSRIAHVDQHVSPAERTEMTRRVAEHGDLPLDHADLVVDMATRQSEIFGGTEDFLVTREFNALASREEKLALIQCLFAVSSADRTIATTEDNEIRRISRELRIEHAEFIAVRARYRRHLAVLRPKAGEPGTNPASG